MNASTFWGTFDQLLGREAQRNGGQDTLKVGTWMSAYAGIRMMGAAVRGLDGGGSGGASLAGSDGFTSLSAIGTAGGNVGGGGLSFPSIFQQSAGNQEGTGAGAGGQPGGGGNKNSQRKGKNRKKIRLMKPKIKQLCETDVLPAEYLGPKIEYTVNLPRVTATLEKLMGTNVVRLTDRKYMQELQRRIQEDYNVTLEKRIAEREAKEMERERNLILTCAGDAIPEGFNSSVFHTNKKSNQHICNKREKLKTIREKNAERLIKQGLRWERERLQMEEYNRQKEIERRSRREALLEQEKLYMIEDSERALNLLKLKGTKGPGRDLDLRALLMQQRHELGQKIQKRDFDLTEDRQVDSDRGKDKKRRSSKHTVRKPKSAVSSEPEGTSPEEGYISMAAIQVDSTSELESSIVIKIDRDGGEDSDLIDDLSTLEGSEVLEGGGSETEDPDEEEAAKAAEAEAMKEEMNRAIEKKKSKAKNEDPKITKLKQADTVNDIYNIADEIIVLEKKKGSKKGPAANKML
ncbi:uncharacterized protein LOC129745090 [Uranotaenia lowii]|uniref:uncharacterized protein LOC129745090 n=1 Tax=Uranotaenia lowii TaxID=190385 RepID=UPI0024789307|nr:uncharacterized protein LOC129745090 [Uranotaenia lowii]